MGARRAKNSAMNETPRKILLVEDDEEISRLLSAFFTREGVEVFCAGDAATASEMIARHAPDLLLLDLMLPGEDGLSLCRRLRAQGGPPIIMVTAKGDSVDRIIGLELGADDYVTKPFDPRELLARARAVLRRAAAPPPAPNQRLAFTGYVLDLDARALSGPNGAIALTSAEFELLASFVRKPRRVLTRDHLLDLVHGRAHDPFDRAIDMLVSRLRKKLGRPDLIATVRNGGYIFTAPVAPAS